jgi:tape measure domain-containing protein
MSAATNVTLGFKDHLTKGMTAPIHAMGRFKNSITGVVRALTSTRGLMMSFATGFGGFRLAESFIDANASLEKMTIQLNAMMGSAAKGKEAMAWIRDFQLRNPIADLETMVKSFNQLVSAGINPTTGALKAMVGAMAKFGLTADNLKSITRATRQMTALTNAQKQELNQLVEQIPMLTAMVAKEMGMSQEKLLKELEDRKIDSKSMASAMFRGLLKETDGMVEEMTGTWEAGMNRLKTSWSNMMTALGNSGLFDKIKEKMEGLTTVMSNNQSLMISYMNNVINVGSNFLDIFIEANNVMNGAVGPGGFLKVYMTGIDTIFTTLGMGFAAIASYIKMIGALFTGYEKRLFYFQERVSKWVGGKGPSEKLSDEIKELTSKRASMVAIHNQNGAGILSGEFGDTTEIKKISAEIDEKIALLKRYKSYFKEEDEYEVIGKDLMNNLKKSTDELFKRTNLIERAFNPKTYQIPPVTITGTKPLNIPGTIDPFAMPPNAGYPDMSRLSYSDLVGPNDWRPNAEAHRPDSFLEGMNRGLDEMTKKFDEAYGTWEKKGVAFAEITARSMGDAFDEFFFDVLEGNLKKATDYFNSFFKSIAKSIAQIVNQQIAMGIVSGIVGSFGGTLQGGSYQTAPVNRTPTTGGGTMVAKPMQVNIINESGQPVRAKSATASQSASGMALNLVIEGLSRNENGSRDAMRAMLA